MSENGSYKRTRIAPTPSGYLHAGNALSFIYTLAWARKTGASLLLRIDDLDRQRVRQSYIDDIFETLHYLQIPWQEGPHNAEQFRAQYAQLHRLPLYHSALEYLKNSGQLFACTCSRAAIEREGKGIYPGTCYHKQIPFSREGVTWRLRTQPGETVMIHSPLAAPAETPLPPEMNDMIVRKRDGYPSYQLASVLDDLHFGVDLVIRGRDLLPSTVAQLVLAKRLPDNSFHQTGFIHHPLISDSAGKKMAKSAGAESIRQMRKTAANPADLLAKLGRLAGIEAATPTLQDLMQQILPAWSVQ